MTIYLNQSTINRDLNAQISNGTCVILNTLVNKNVILVQYRDSPSPYGTGPVAHSPEYSLISCKNRISLDFGATWTEIDMSNTGGTWGGSKDLGYTTEVDRIGPEGCMAAFMVRNSTGTRVYIYTPIYKLFNFLMELETYKAFRSPPAAIVGWLVHDHNGLLVTYTDMSSDRHVVPEINAPINIRGSSGEGVNSPDEVDLNPLSYLSSFQDFKGRLNPITGQISQYVPPASIAQGLTERHAHPAHNWRFSSLPYEGRAWSFESESHKETNLINPVDTVDYVHNGKRYTILKMFRNVFVRKGNIFKEAGNMYVDAYGFDHYMLTLPFIYVYDHSKFNIGDCQFEWVDVLNLNNRLVSLENSARGNTRAKAFIRSLISEDQEFQTATGPDNGYSAYGEDHHIINSIVYFLKTPHGELLKVHDKQDKQDLVGLLFGNRRFVCRDNPLLAQNWILGGVTGRHYYPSVKRAFAFDVVKQEGILTARDNPIAKYSHMHDMSYMEFSTPFSKHASMQFDVASDRVVAIADTVTYPKEIVYRYVGFIKDLVSGRYSIGFLPEVTKLGYKELTGQNFTGTGAYPVEVTAAKGMLYSTQDFIMNESVPAYVDPSDPGSDLPVEQSVNVTDSFDLSNYTKLSEACVYFSRVGTFQHNITNQITQIVIENESPGCGFVGTSNEPKAARVWIYDPLKLAVNKVVHANESIDLEIVFTGAGQAIIRAPAGQIGANNGFVLSGAGTISVTAKDPTYFGLTQSTATFNVNTSGETVINVGNYSQSNEMLWLSAVRTSSVLFVQNGQAGPSMCTAVRVNETQVRIDFDYPGPIGGSLQFVNNNGTVENVPIVNRSLTTTRSALMNVSRLQFI